MFLVPEDLPFDGEETRNKLCSVYLPGLELCVPSIALNKKGVCEGDKGDGKHTKAEKGSVGGEKYHTSGLLADSDARSTIYSLCVNSP